MWEKALNIHEVTEIRTRTTVFFGVGAIEKIKTVADQMKTLGISRVLICAGRGSYKSTGAWAKISEALISAGISWVLYDRVTPNPTDAQVDEATKLGHDFKAQAVIAIGGGSPIDTGKSAAILLNYPDKSAAELYEYRFVPTSAVPICAVNLTHGTGTETNRFAVVTVTRNEFKPAIAYDFIYPTWAIDDPALCTGLSPIQTRYVSVDAVNHVVEAATSTAANAMSVMLAKETIRLVGLYLPAALKNPDDLEARYFLMYAAMIAGMSFDNGLLHYTHALEHPLSAVKPELPHGLGLAILLPAVIENIYPARGEVLADILSGIVPGLTGEAKEAARAARGVELWLKSVGISEKLSDEGFSEVDIPKLTGLAFDTPSLAMLLGVAPTDATAEAVASIYRRSLTPIT